MNEKDTKVIMKKVERRGGAHNLHDRFMQEGIEEGDNQKMMSFVNVIGSLPEIDVSKPMEVSKRCDEYFELCEQYDMKPAVSGLAMSLGVDRRTLWAWVTGQLRVSNQDIIKKAYRKLEFMWENYMNSGKINPVSGIFLAKNNFDYQDKTEIKLVNGGNDSDPQTVEDDYANERSAIEGEPDDVPEIDKKPN